MKFISVKCVGFLAVFSFKCLRLFTPLLFEWYGQHALSGGLARPKIRYGAVAAVSVRKELRRRWRRRRRRGDYSLLFNLNKINDSCFSPTIFFSSARSHLPPLFAIVLNGSEEPKEKEKSTQRNSEKKAKRGHFYCHESETVLLNNTLNIYQRILKSGVCVRL